MSIFEEQPLNELGLGEIIRIPCECIEPSTKPKFNKSILKNITTQLKKSGKNILPVFIKQVDEDNYKAIHNILVLEAAKKAKLDFIFCIAVDDLMESQLLLEIGDKLQVSLIDSSEKQIKEVLEFAQGKNPKLKRLKVDKVVTTIIDARTPSWQNLKPLSKLKCGVGAKTAAILGDYFTFPD